MQEARQADLVFSTYSLDAPMSDRDDPALLADMLGDDDPDLAHAIDMEAVNAHWEELPEREQRILVMRFYGNLTQTEIGERLGISQMHVSRLLARALGHLKSRLLDPAETDNPNQLPRPDELRRPDSERTIMKTGVGLALIAIGAILAFAVTTNTSVFNLHTAGWVLIIIGIIGIAIPRRGYGWVGRRVFTRQTRWRPGARVEEVTYPTYVNRNPANTRVQAGLPAPGALGSPEAAEPHRRQLRHP